MAWQSREVSLLLVDVGNRMQDPITACDAKKRSKASVALDLVKCFVQQKFIFSPKHEIGVILFGSAKTSNELQDDGYPHVYVLRDGVFGAPNIAFLKLVTSLAADSGSGGAPSDAVNGLIVALDLLIKRTKDQKYNKTVYLLTDDQSVEAGDEDIVECARQLEATDIRLKVTVVGSSRDDVWRSMMSMCTHVDLLPLAVAAHEFSLFVKRFQARAKARMTLTIAPGFDIPIGIYTKTASVQLPTIKKRSKMTTVTVPGDIRTDKVITECKYYLADDPEGEEVMPENCIKGHKYGGSIVPMSEYDEAALKYTCSRTLTVLCFTPATTVRPEHSITHVETVAADRGDLWAFAALSSLVNAMILERCVLIARHVPRNDAQPKMVALIPRTGDDCGVWLDLHYLPFTEDIREWPFASLPAPSFDQREAVDKLVSSMDLEMAAARGPASSAHAAALSIAGAEVHAGPQEPLRPENTYNPALWRFYNFLCARAVDPKAKVPPPSGWRSDAIQVSAVLAEQAKAAMCAEALKSAFRLEKVEKPSKKVKRYWREAILEKHKEAADLGEVDTKRIKIDSYLKKDEKDEVVKEEYGGQPGHLSALVVPVVSAVPPVVKVGSVHPERDFEHWLSRPASGFDVVGQAIEQMCSIIDRLADESDEHHGKAFSCLTVLRRGCVQEGEAVTYNNFVRRLRTAETKRRKSFWEKVRASSLGLITAGEVVTSPVTLEESRAFLRGEEVSFTRLSASGDSAVPLSERDLEAMIE